MSFLQAGKLVRAPCSRTIFSTSKPSTSYFVTAKPGYLNEFEGKQVINRISEQSIRFSHQEARKELAESSKDEKWIAIYRYPSVRLAVILARAKLIQTIASVLYLPYSTYQYMSDQVDLTYYYTSASLAVLAPIMLIIFSRYLNRLIGVIAMNENNERVRIGYLTFWGSRKNVVLEVSDVVSLSEISGTLNDQKMCKFMWFSGGSKFLYLPIKHAEILDEQRAQLLFGDISMFETPKQK